MSVSSRPHVGAAATKPGGRPLPREKVNTRLGVCMCASSPCRRYGGNVFFGGAVQELSVCVMNDDISSLWFWNCTLKI